MASAASSATSVSDSASNTAVAMSAPMPAPVSANALAIPEAAAAAAAVDTKLEIKVSAQEAPAPVSTPMSKFPITPDSEIDPKTNLPRSFLNRVGYFSVRDYIRQFQNINLEELIGAITKQQFINGATRYCYSISYADLKFTGGIARNANNVELKTSKDNYLIPMMHTMSGEQFDLCFYTYQPDDLTEFLKRNESQRYVFLPIMVTALESANGHRHDMLLIFDNASKLFYWFDCRNREDYLPFGKNIPKNAIDVLLINFAQYMNGSAEGRAKFGYNYEPSPSWVITSVLQPFGSIGEFDFIISTAWCYLIICNLRYYESPIGLLSALDCMPIEDRFHLLYLSILRVIGDYNLSRSVPEIMQRNIIEPSSTMLPETKNNDPLPAIRLNVPIARAAAENINVPADIPAKLINNLPAPPRLETPSKKKEECAVA
jgi:hypothetical protein